MGYSGKHRIKGVKHSVAGDANGHPLACKVSKANWHDQKLAVETIDAITISGRCRRPKRLGLDKGYDSDLLRKEMRARRIVPCFSTRVNHILQLAHRERREQKYCRNRWKIERTFAWLNMNRRIDRLLERKLKSYAMFLDLACIRHYLRLLVLKLAQLVFDNLDQVPEDLLLDALRLIDDIGIDSSSPTTLVQHIEAYLRDLFNFMSDRVQVSDLAQYRKKDK